MMEGVCTIPALGSVYNFRGSARISKSHSTL
uniref:Uncharacterized protein n=1 Tax=Rhizophora mucronata TaxID=61149 RepID=A0A2P2Q887_RHIMU